jgi:ribosomal protein S18 acetylase RimI-like enzyme
MCLGEPTPEKSALRKLAPAESWEVTGRTGIVSRTMEITIRHAHPDENKAIHCMVQVIANETFADLFPSQVPIGEPNWLPAWVAVSDGIIVGVTMTREEWVSDLWVRRESRRFGIGTRLLAQAESEIANRGHETFRLRVVRSNVPAVQFYLAHGWQVEREFPHEKFNHQMFELVKHNPARVQT